MKIHIKNKYKRYLQLVVYSLLAFKRFLYKNVFFKIWLIGDKSDSSPYILIYYNHDIPDLPINVTVHKYTDFDNSLFLKIDKKYEFVAVFDDNVDLESVIIKLIDKIKKFRYRKIALDFTGVALAGQVAALDGYKVYCYKNKQMNVFYPVKQKTKLVAVSDKPIITDSFYYKKNDTLYINKGLRILNLEIESRADNGGGLGDHLFYSHLPQIAKESGKYDKVYISENSKYRSTHIRDLVWETNPYIDGYADKPGITLDWRTIWTNVNSFNASLNSINLLDLILIYLDLDDGKRIHEPKLYFKPNLKPELSDIILYEPNFITDSQGVTEGKVLKYFESNNVQYPNAVMAKRNRTLDLPHIDNILTSKDLFDFCDILCSVKKFYAVITGAATLSCALNVEGNIFITDSVAKIFVHSKKNKYIML